MKDKIFTICIALFLLLGLYFSVKNTAEIKSIKERMDRQDVEYQLIIEDDSLIIFDKDRFVGKVKCQGQLDSLLIEDNL